MISNNNIEETPTDTVIELSCNVDDMTGEEVGFAIEKLLKEGAREAFAIPVIMKKSRPGMLITVLAGPEDRDRMVRAIFAYTKTIGIRETSHKRYVLHRTIENCDSPWGPVRKKVSAGYGVRREKYEYDDLKAIANRYGIGIEEVRKGILNGSSAGLITSEEF